MPAMNPTGSGASGAGGSGAGGTGPGPGRTTFRPPWVKDGPQPIPMPTAPWTPNRAQQIALQNQPGGAPGRKLSNASQDGTKGPEAPPQRKASKITIFPSAPSVVGAPKENGQPVASESRRSSQTQQLQQTAPAPAPVQVQPAAPEKKRERAERPTLTHQKSSTAARPAAPPSPTTNAPQAPPPPPAPPAPPAPPPPPVLLDKKPLSETQKQKIELLKNRPRKRPDYSCLMKEIESGAKLKRVQCNDRSRPLLPRVKAKGQFVYESEKANLHNQLLKQIEGGIKLKRVKTNDRSRPILDGLRKFRRQMTIEEQLQKAEVAEELAEEPDDLDDIDRVRDDLQSTKQMLALELRNKEALERENKRLQSRLLNLEAELENERAAKSGQEGAGQTSAAPKNGPDDDKLVAKLKEEAESSERVAKEMEGRYHEAAEELDSTKSKLEEALYQRKQLEKRLKELEDGLIEGGRALQKQLSKKLIASKSGDLRKQASAAKVYEQRKSSMPAAKEEDSDSEYTEETVTESEEESEEEAGEDDAAAQERRVQRELKLLATKLKAFKDKETSARKERKALKEQLRAQQAALKEERAKYKALQKEVDKMAKLMKEDDEEGEDDDDEEEDDDDEEEESESESEESEDDGEASGEDLPPEAPVDDRRKNLNARTKRHEGILGALKKGNYLLKANIDRLKDDLSKHREMSLTLQEDLNSVLAELG